MISEEGGGKGGGTCISDNFIAKGEMGGGGDGARYGGGVLGITGGEKTLPFRACSTICSGSVEMRIEGV